MSYGIKIEVWGKYACFSRPEFSVERVSYDCITPSAAKGLIESIYFHPGLKIMIDKIHVLNPIRFTNIRRNELKSKALASSVLKVMNHGGTLPYINTKTDIQQRASLILRDVRYVIEAHFEMTNRAHPEDNPAKFKEIFTRRIKKGQCYCTPCFGNREFPANFKPVDDFTPTEGFYAHDGERDLGFMLYGMDYSDPQDITPMFYRTIMRNGVIDVAGSEVYK